VSAPQQPLSPSDSVHTALAGLGCELSIGRDGIATVVLARELVHEALARLRDRAGFEQCTLVTAVDHLVDEAELATPRERYEVVWQLLCTTRVLGGRAERVRVRARVPESDARVASCVDLWPGAAYAERECFDMFGIRFDGHAGLKRLLMPEEYEHFPLRKDFPHQGIEPDRLYRAWDRARRATDPAVPHA
jgi:NADH-quinone oxidoreductase subunit C